MGTKLLRSAYQDLRSFLDHLHGIWGSVADQVGAGYELAYMHYKDSMPTYVLREPPELFELGLETAVHWLGHGKRALVWVPVVGAINSGVRYLYKNPPNKKINNPYVNMDPAKFKSSIRHYLDVVFINLKDYVDVLIQEADDTTVIPRLAAEEMWNQMALSPISYPPRNWEKWQGDEIADEFERRLYVRWAKKLAHSHPPLGSLGSYRYKKIVERLADLTKNKTTGGVSLTRAMMKRNKD